MSNSQDTGAAIGHCAPDILSVIIERYAAGLDGRFRYGIRAVVETQAVRINAYFEADRENTIEAVSSKTSLRIDLSQGYTITLLDPRRLHRPMLSHINQEALKKIESIDISEPYLYEYRTAINDHYYLRRWTVTFSRRTSLHQKRQYWAMDIADEKCKSTWEVLENYDAPLLPDQITRMTQREIEEEVMPKLKKTLEIFNMLDSKVLLTAEMLWHLQDDMVYSTWMGSDVGGVDLEEMKSKKGVCFVMRGREEAPRMYRSATRKGNASVWTRCPK
ncbi:hypothetical protein Slin15195_G115000 [Septoria linicola]|uniref:Uncharacterized protein n=1 Tax=Septoria linicola TaxID=215465 RepID=A0A9Q9B880_9PEZI|nr:hypothetical protein Slin14017_G122970 [Septoria linicola]USW58181.1 hypothetical protein Slin15195_G115000 [Septoria linicola]